MVTMRQQGAPPPAYSGNQASNPPPPSYDAGVAPPASYPVASPAQQATAQPTGCAYWTYWGFLFATPLIWVFAVTAAASDAWIEGDYGAELSLEDASDCHSSWEETCDLLTASQAFQYLATILISVVCVMVFISACMGAPVSQKLGLAAGIMLAVFSVFELITFAMMAVVVQDIADTNSDWGVDVSPGPAFGVAVTAWILGTAAAITVLAMWGRAVRGQDGACRRCINNSKTVNTAGQPQVPAVGTV